MDVMKSASALVRENTFCTMSLALDRNTTPVMNWPNTMRHSRPNSSEETASRKVSWLAPTISTCGAAAAATAGTALRAASARKSAPLKDFSVRRWSVPGS